MPSLSVLISFISLALFLSDFVHCAPHPKSELQPRSVVDCNDINADFDESCWETLGLTDWLKKWSPPICGETQSTADCCDATMEWSSCFLKLGIKPGYNCTSISQDTCAYSPSLREVGLDSSIKPQVRYILLNIFYVHAFFNDWYTAINGATGAPCSAVIDAIIQEVDPEQKTHSFLNIFLDVLTAGLAFIPEVGPEVAVVTRVATNALVKGIKAAPGVAQKLWPAGTVNSQAVQISELKSALSTVSGDLKARLNGGLHEVMLNQASFADFASSGLFSGAAAPSIPDDEDALIVGFKTYLLTRAMTANKWFSRVSPGLEAKPDVINPCYPLTAGSTDCYWDAGSKLQYTIMNRDHENKVHELQTDIVGKGWSNYPLMFQGSVDCAGMGGYGDGNGKLVNFGEDGALDLSCFAQLDTCADWDATEHKGEDYKTAPCITGLVNGGCPVRTCLKGENGAGE